jgi:ATP-binding cassette subfamily F protein 3
MIQLQNISKSFSSQELFHNINLKLNHGNKVGLVGRNGSGKSTLFKIIMQEEHPDSGEVIIPKNYHLGSLKQHLHFSEDTLIKEASLALAHEMQYDTYRVEKILFGLGFSQEDLEKNPLSFSGGYQIRINLAKLLVTQPHLLLLDEPTNYLDIVSMRWLEGFLRNFDGEIILITHDRNFMDSVCTHTMGLVRKSLKILEGNTQKFYTQLAQDEELHVKTKATQDKKVKELEEFIARNKARASTASLAQSKVKQLEKMHRLEDLTHESSLDFLFHYKATPAKVLLEVEKLSFGYTPENTLFQNINFTLAQGKTLGIIGKNGKGKSTLLNLIAKELTPLHGQCHYNTNTLMAHFGQTNINHLNPDNTIMDEIYNANAKLSEAQVRSICGAMMFSGSMAEKKVALLSGGEKSRVMLGQIIAREINLLLLDEPTNHLDMQSIEALTEAIIAFKGSTILVTHSEELLRRVCDTLIIFNKNGAEYFDGGYDDFLTKIGWEEEEEQNTTKKAPKSNTKENKKLRSERIRQRNKKLAPLRKNAEKLETKIMHLEEELEHLHVSLVEASNAGESATLMELSKKVALQEEEVENLFETLELCHNEIDTITQEFEAKTLE